MNVATLKALTWATVAAAVLSALWLAALGPDTGELAIRSVRSAGVTPDRAVNAGSERTLGGAGSTSH